MHLYIYWPFHGRCPSFFFFTNGYSRGCNASARAQSNSSFGRRHSSQASSSRRSKDSFKAVATFHGHVLINLHWDMAWREFWWMFGQIICWRAAIESVNVHWWVFWERSCIKWADGLYFPAWISGENQWAHRGRFVGKLFYLPFLCAVMGKAKWLLTADGQWLSPNESKVFWCRWYNEDEVGQLIIATNEGIRARRAYVLFPT